MGKDAVYAELEPMAAHMMCDHKEVSHLEQLHSFLFTLIVFVYPFFPLRVYLIQGKARIQEQLSDSTLY